jgi:hypothetical protein
VRKQGYFYIQKQHFSKNTSTEVQLYISTAKEEHGMNCAKEYFYIQKQNFSKNMSTEVKLYISTAKEEHGMNCAQAGIFLNTETALQQEHVN